MNHAEAYVKFLCQWLPDNCLDDMEFMADMLDETCINRLRMTVAATDVLVPKVGELIGGSQREEHYEVIQQSI
nr:asparagine--trna ligase, cytoplasmic 3 [Quercus suber]